MNGVQHVTATSVCCDIRYHRPIHNTGTVMFQSTDIQVPFTVFEQQRLALSNIMWTVLFKHRTAYLTGYGM